MIRMGISEARRRFSELLNWVQAGRTIEITRRGKPVARLCPVEPAKSKPLPDMTEFHRRLGIHPKNSKSLVATIRQLREQERY